MNIIKNRFKFFAVSVILIICGIAAMVINTSKGNGIFNFDIEFTGGTSMQFDIGKEFDNKDIEKIIKDGCNIYHLLLNRFVLPYG